MAKPATERLLLGAFAYFLESGTTVDSITVAAETVVSPAAGKPDAVPTSNWVTLGDVEMAKFTTVEAEEKYLVPSAAGGYDEKVEKRVIADLLELKLQQSNEFVARLVAGAGAITLGTAQAAHAVRDRYVEGWLRIQARKQGGTDHFLLDWWCQMRLKDIPEISEKTQRPTLEFRKLYSTLNSVNFPS
jgi:hypothetical protein